jgi:DNA repair exonuclease SbcCD ATPase subunit
VAFTIRGTGGFNFEAMFPGQSQPIKITELSGGQKIDLSLAFRFAACESFSSSAGLLVLDEPSVYLDEDTKQHLVEVFERLKDMAEQMRMQFLVVTHERSLLGCFDQLVQFGGGI